MRSDWDNQVYVQELATFYQKLSLLVLLYFFPVIKTNPCEYDSNVNENAV